jgi:membrane-associated phospholipid phosphatase
VGYFTGILDFTLTSHRNTFLLCASAMTVGQFVATHWKREFRRVRPARLDPALAPPVAVPGHASYPSGHATQAMLIALLLEQVLPEKIIPDFVTAPPGQPETGPLRRLARRIARNREVLGVHYPTDTACGFKLAARALRVLLDCPVVHGTTGSTTEQERPQAPLEGDMLPANTGGGSLFADGLLARARAEWK